MNETLQLEELARLHGVQTSYVSNAGQIRKASPETLRAVLKTLGVEAEGDLDAAIQYARNLQLRRIVEPVIVQWDGVLKKAPVIRAKSGTRRAKVEAQIVSESGDTRRVQIAKTPRRKKPDGDAIDEWEMVLPRLAEGYHILRVRAGREDGEALVISARGKLYQPDGRLRQWGVFLPMYAAHSGRSWGAGTFSDWKRLAEWVGDNGGQVLGTLPIMSAFLDHPVIEPSPYSPASRLFWNEFYVDLMALPEFSSSAAAAMFGSGGVQREIRKFREAECVDYEGEWELKRAFLEKMAARFFKSRGNSALHRIIKNRPELETYAQFRAANDKYTTSWHTWPEKARAGKLGRNDFSRETANFYLYAQAAAQSQMNEILDLCRRRGLRFYLDLPLGVNPDSYDAWRYPKFFAKGASAGAPPDSFFTKGQDWGFAPLDPHRTRELKYRYVIDYLRFQMRHTGMLRIDHVMGLHRLYWIPHGLAAKDGAYVSYPADELYAILSVESHRHKTMLVGENLGTVPPEVNKSMDKHGLRRMYVLQYEQGPTGAPPEPPKAVAASLNTHDMPMFAAHWNGLDLTDRVDLGLIPKKNLPAEKANREKLRRNLARFLRSKGFLKGTKTAAEQVLAAALEFLGNSPAETVLVNLEDLWLEVTPQNTPGTSTERPNWRHKAKFSLEELENNAAIAAILERLKKTRKRK